MHYYYQSIRRHLNRDAFLKRKGQLFIPASLRAISVLFVLISIVMAFRDQDIDKKEARTLKFIEDYKSLPFLWDSNHPQYYKNDKRNEALEKLSNDYNISIMEVKNKIKNVRSYFMKEYQKIKEDKTYETNWFAYSHMSFILASKQEELESNGNHEPLQDPEQNCNTPPRKTPAKNRPSKIANNATVEPVIESYQSISSVEYAPVSDDFYVFGQVVANQIRKLSRRNQAIARNTIQNFLFDMEMKEIQQQNEQEKIGKTGKQSLVPRSRDQNKKHGDPGRDGLAKESNLRILLA